MQIIEHQNIQLNNLISYTRNIRHSDILKLTKYISDNLHVLDLTQSDKILFTESKPTGKDDRVNTEILIPVNGNIIECDEFQYKPSFNLINAVSIRHEGSLEKLPQTESHLISFIQEKHYVTISPTYYVIIRNGETFSSNCIIDIYVEVNITSS